MQVIFDWILKPKNKQTKTIKEIIYQCGDIWIGTSISDNSVNIQFSDCGCKGNVLIVRRCMLKYLGVKHGNVHK